MYHSKTSLPTCNMNPTSFVISVNVVIHMFSIPALSSLPWGRYRFGPCGESRVTAEIESFKLLLHALTMTPAPLRTFARLQFLVSRSHGDQLYQVTDWQQSWPAREAGR